MFLIIAAYFAILTIMAFIMMKVDKHQAQRRGQRIPEKNLWTVAIFGGGIGAYLGMMAFRHKTKHTNFRVGFLMLAMLDAAILIWCYLKFFNGWA
ncbi:DUF1294 domain-containing protein [Microbacterium sp. APC 3898]|uniref:DUF1294 domain-containing protein n=1 Tax=Planococcus notacanthi TaxID=3035188 RepID=A0ABT7ZIL1_9BACL|nr:MULTISPECIES: DUF1294 domain-containing protein [Terrabacteria group]MBF6633346.1 DUF1294 domain-containing protein [Planococcus sp. (in: firmicutes)]MDN3426995.1 DUF1294 domain-containing protein [Planococcus sp. APC 4016]MDN3499857.1 DUF1294 domain-containing protein [Microbacterium sp. APC 3898]